MHHLVMSEVPHNAYLKNHSSVRITKSTIQCNDLQISMIDTHIHSYFTLHNNNEQHDKA